MIASTSSKEARRSADDANRQRDLAAKQSVAAKAESKRANAISSFLTETFLSNSIYQSDAGSAQEKRAIDLLNAGADRILTSLGDDPIAKRTVLK